MSINIDKDLANQLKPRAKKLGVSVSYLVNRSIRFYLAWIDDLNREAEVMDLDEVDRLYRFEEDNYLDSKRTL